MVQHGPKVLFTNVLPGTLRDDDKGKSGCFLKRAVSIGIASQNKITLSQPMEIFVSWKCCLWPWVKFQPGPRKRIISPIFKQIEKSIQTSSRSNYQWEQREIPEYLLLSPRPRDAFQCNSHLKLRHLNSLKCKPRTAAKPQEEGRAGTPFPRRRYRLPQDSIPLVKSEVVFQDRTVATLRR